MIRWIAILCFIVSANTLARAEETFDADSLVFHNVFCSRKGDRVSYSIVGTGAFRAPRVETIETFIVSWLNRHPHATARIVEQSTLGPKLGLMDYIWIDKGNDSLNIDLVRQGIVPGGMMADGVEYLTSIKDAIHLDLTSPDFPKRVIDEGAYHVFMDRVVIAESAARSDRIGLWSDEYREMMKQEGYIPE
ncbi:hypothetical protein [Lichenibacterium dinghuense]|uniref:hypothetical protein n=1 Tax=Lichenibacterium dinghuense TaxID=2895977 RepID=UPI001F38A6AB|nr:hypothetical protein [Lichenibacterium sp. 6Y81]